INIEGDMISVKGPKGTLSQRLSPYIKVAIEENKLWVQQNEESIVRRSQRKMLRTFQGTYWSLIKNMITGVTEGFEKQLEIVGVGYRAQLQGNKVSLQLGYTHPIVLEPPVGVSVEVPAPNVVVVKGIDKQKVGQFAAEVRSWRKVNVYSGKGVKYRNEVVKLKEGKKA
ncbi:50S ribosomal protein L6, partial [Pseudothermotoga sp.]